ncbi:hypothetical protein OL548_32980 [Lysinibacillus sp. MHQ-1]|nr:hypothetical protein OL548_32980 [Lysinibacillus sp. MHQ-1]
MIKLTQEQHYWGDDQVLLYGHQLNTIDVYTLSTGEKLYSQKVEVGTTNVYYDNNIKQFFYNE